MPSRGIRRHRRVEIEAEILLCSVCYFSVNLPPPSRMAVLLHFLAGGRGGGVFNYIAQKILQLLWQILRISVGE